MIRKIIDYIIDRKEKSALEKYGCVCYCPRCSTILQEEPCTKLNDSEYRYDCKCGYKSVWNYDIAPVPIQVMPEKVCDNCGDTGIDPYCYEYEGVQYPCAYCNNE